MKNKGIFPKQGGGVVFAIQQPFLLHILSLMQCISDACICKAWSFGDTHRRMYSMILNQTYFITWSVILRVNDV